MWRIGMISGNAAKPLMPESDSRRLFPRRPPAVGPSALRIRAEAAATAGVSEDASFYDLLGIPQSGSVLEIKTAYKQLARRYHPDVSPPGRAEEYTQAFIRVQEAYETLSDPGRRAAYDRNMAKGLRLAFCAGRRRGTDDVVTEDQSQWKMRWGAQLWELERRSRHKDADPHNMSWGARMRRRRSETSPETS